jgi:hypothetical protein
MSREAQGVFSLGPGLWTEHSARPDLAEIRAPDGSLVLAIDSPGGYPFFLDGRIFVMGAEQSSVALIGADGSAEWTFEFSAPVTALDAAGGMLAAGLLDGEIVLVDGQGRLAHSFEPGGSRISIALAVALSPDGSRLAAVSGLDPQRFLALERHGPGPGDWRVAYHEFVGEGLRKPAMAAFSECGSFAVFERPGGLGVYDAAGRSARFLEFEGELAALDAGSGRLAFALFAQAGGMMLAGIDAGARPPRAVMRARFGGSEAFLGRAGSRLVVGGGGALAAFDIGER